MPTPSGCPNTGFCIEDRTILGYAVFRVPSPVVLPSEGSVGDVEAASPVLKEGKDSAGTGTRTVLSNLFRVLRTHCAIIELEVEGFKVWAPSIMETKKRNTV